MQICTSFFPLSLYNDYNPLSVPPNRHSPTPVKGTPVTSHPKRRLKKKSKSAHIFPKITVGDSHELIFLPTIAPTVFFWSAHFFICLGAFFLAPTIPPIVFFPPTILRLNECDIFDRFKAKARYSDGYVLEFYYLIKSVLMLF